MNSVCFVEVHESEESVEFSGEDVFRLDLEDVLEGPLEVVFINGAVEVPIEALEGFLDGDAGSPDPLADLLNHIVFPVEVVIQVVRLQL